MQLRKRQRRVRQHNRRCWYCGRPLYKGAATRDHQLPVCKGGSSTNGNIVWSCEPCNHKKANQTVEQFRTMLTMERRRPVIFWGEGGG